MAGFGTVMTQPSTTPFPDRILNTHPALLPAFPGWHGVRDALAAGVPETGCTVHLATLEMDAGPILAQEVVPVLPGDTEATLHERIKVVERTLYPATMAWALASSTTGRARSPTRRRAREQPEEVTREGPAVRVRQGGSGRAGPGPVGPGVGAGRQREHLGQR